MHILKHPLDRIYTAGEAPLRVLVEFSPYHTAYHGQYVRDNEKGIYYVIDSSGLLSEMPQDRKDWPNHLEKVMKTQ